MPVAAIPSRTRLSPNTGAITGSSRRPSTARLLGRIGAGGLHLDQLLDKDMITGREYQQALRFRRTYEAGHCAALTGSAWDKVYADRYCRTPAPEMTERQAGALARLAAIRAALGALHGLLELVVIDDASWCAIGRQFGIDARTAKAWCAGAIAGLARL